MERIKDANYNPVKRVMKFMNLIQFTFFHHPRLAWVACLRITKVELELLRDSDVLPIIEKDIRGGTSHAIYR